MSVRGLIAGGMSAPEDGAGSGGGSAETVVPLQAAAPTAVTVEDELADGEDIDALGELAAATLGGCDDDDDDGGGGTTGPSLSDTILAALVAAELLKLRLHPPPRPDAERIEWVLSSAYILATTLF